MNTLTSPRIDANYSHHQNCASCLVVDKGADQLWRLFFSVRCSLSLNADVAVVKGLLAMMRRPE